MITADHLSIHFSLRHLPSSWFHPSWQDLRGQLRHVTVHSLRECHSPARCVPAVRMRSGFVHFPSHTRISFLTGGFAGYMLVGNRGATCFSGVWRPDQLPVCNEGSPCRRSTRVANRCQSFRSARVLATHAPQICQQRLIPCKQFTRSLLLFFSFASSLCS